jgi:hypothetical protein
MRKTLLARSTLCVAAVVCVPILACGGRVELADSRPDAGTGGVASGSIGGSSTTQPSSGTGGRNGAGGSITGSGGSLSGTGGSAATGGAGTNLCQGVSDNGDCADFGADFVCDRSTSTRDPRVCTCTDNESGNLTWVCVREAAGTAGAGNPGSGGTGNPGTGGAGTVGTGGAGVAGAGDAALSCRGVSDNGDCTDFGADFVCDRSTSTRDPRVCTCTDDPSGNLTWVCVRDAAGTAGAGNPGTAGAGNPGAAGAGNPGTGGAGTPGTGGASMAGTGNSAPDCRGVGDGGDCTDFGADFVCNRSASPRNPRVCTCDASTLTWTCVRANAGSAGTGNAGAGTAGTNG